MGLVPRSVSNALVGLGSRAPGDRDCDTVTRVDGGSSSREGHRGNDKSDGEVHGDGKLLVNRRNREDSKKSWLGIQGRRRELIYHPGQGSFEARTCGMGGYKNILWSNSVVVDPPSATTS